MNLRALRAILSALVGVANRGRNKMLYEDREQDLAKLTRALILVEDNRNTSSSRTGLETRGANLDQIAEILLDVLDLSENDLGDLYSDWIEVGDDTNTGQ